MKHLLVTLSAIALFTSTSAQQVIEGPRPFERNVSGNALHVMYTGQPDNVEQVLKEWLESAAGERSRSRRGKVALEGVRISAFSPNTLDYYVEVDKVSRRDKEHAEVYVFVSAGNDNFISSQTSPSVMNAVKDWLYSMQREITMYELGLAMEAQEKVLDKEQDRLEDLRRDSVDLQALLAETLANIEQNKLDQAAQRQTVQQENERLEAFRQELELVRRGPSADEAVMRVAPETQPEAATSPDSTQQRGPDEQPEIILEYQPGGRED